ncbi:MAG: hypothetical protein V3V08_23600 [Nannocystaceae bacterium]
MADQLNETVTTPQPQPAPQLVDPATTLEDDFKDKEALRLRKEKWDFLNVQVEAQEQVETQGVLDRISEQLVDAQRKRAEASRDLPAVPGKVAAGAAAAAKDIGKAVPEVFTTAIPGAVGDVARDVVDVATDLGVGGTDPQARPTELMGAFWLNYFTDTPFEGPSREQPTRLERLEAAEKIKELIPHIDQPETVTGQLLREITGFTASMLATRGPILRALSARGLSPVAGRILADANSGFMAGLLTADTAEMRAMEAGFLRLKENNPELAASMEMAVDPTGSWDIAVKRLQTGLVEAGLGAAGDGFIESLRVMRRANRARLLAKDIDAAEQVPTTIERIGDPARVPRSERVLTQADIAGGEQTVRQMFPGEEFTPEEFARLAEESARGPDIEWEDFFTKMNTDPAAAVAEMTDQATSVFSKSIEVARRGTRTIEETSNAAAQAYGVEDILGREVGSGITAEAAVVSIQMQKAASEELFRLARLASGDTAPQFKYQFMKMADLYSRVTEQFFGIRAEAGRTLNIYGNLGKLETTRAKNMADIIEQMGGEGNIEQYAKNMLAMEGRDLNGLYNATLPSRSVRAMRFHQEFYTMGLLWNPSTHIVNMMSPTIVAMTQAAESTVAAAGEAALSRTGRNVSATEGLARMAGLTAGYWSAFQATWRGAKRGARGLPGVTQLQAPGTVAREARAGLSELRDQLDIPAVNKMAENFSISGNVDPDTGIQRMASLARSAIRAPGVSLGIEDDIAKIAGYQAEVWARAAREAAFSGGTAREKMVVFDHFRKNPNSEIRINATQNAQYSTFTDEAGAVIKFTSKARRAMIDNGVPAHIILPFVHTPGKIFAFNLERTPLGAFMPSFKEAVKKGGADESLAYARVATGAGFFSIAMSLAATGRFVTDVGERGDVRSGEETGLITGGRTKVTTTLAEGEIQEALGRPRNGFYIGNGQWGTYDRFDPMISFTLSSAAAIQEVTTLYELDETDIEELTEFAAHSVMAIAMAQKDRSYLQGTSEVVDLFSRMGERGFGASLARYGKRQLFNSTIPASSAVRWASEMLGGTGATVPETNSWQDEYKKQFEAFVGRLPRKRRLFGEEIRKEKWFGPFENGFIPMRKALENREPIYLEMARLQMEKPRLRKRDEFAYPEFAGFAPTIDMSLFPRVYETYQTLAGNDGKYFQGLGTKDQLTTVIETDRYKAIERRDLREKVIKDHINMGRHNARIELMTAERFDDDPEFQAFRTFAREEAQKEAARRQTIPQ